MVSKNSETAIRAKVQILLNNNTARAVGDFHSDELDVDSFVLDMNKTFKISHKNGGCTEELLFQTIDDSIRKVRGRMDARELNNRKFLKSLFESFEIERL